MGRSRPSRIALAAFALALACDLAYLFTVTVLGVDPEAPSIVNIVFRAVAVWGPVAVFWVVVGVTPNGRTPVLLGAMGVTAWATGSAVFNVLAGDGGYVPSPALSDIGYLAFYPLMLGAIVTLAVRGSRRAMLPVALEAAIASLGTASVLLLLSQPVLTAAVSRPWPELRPLTVAYPLLDVALVAVTAGFASSPALAGGRRVWWFIAGVTLFVATDLIYALLAQAGEYHTGAIADAGWPIGLLLLAWWALGFTSEPRRTVIGRSAPALGLIAPVGSVVAAIGVLVYSSQRPVNVASVVLATVTVALTAIPILTRQTLLSRVVAGQESVLTELRELDRSKSEMMATLNHEMRTPLTSILGYLELVRDGDGGDIPPAAASMLEAVDHNAHRLHSIVDEMLVLTQLDTHGLEVQMQPLDVRSTVQCVVEQLTPVAEGRQVSLVLELGETVPDVLGDDARLGHALTTIVENAIKFTPNQGSVTVSVSTRKHERPVVIAVADTGMGVPAGDLPHLFERFYRASNAVQSAVGGSGLGLAIARGIVELHGGRIRADSVLGDGTTITVALPAAE